MNLRRVIFMYTIEYNPKKRLMNVERRQVDEAVLALFHTILFHRSTGKFLYTKDDMYSIGTVGLTDVECDFIDFTYVKCNSETLDTYLRRDVNSFCQAIKSPTTPSSGQISLEFYQRKRGRWPFCAESTTWEVWNLRINLITLNNENERQTWREKVGEKLGEHLLLVTDSVSRGDYIPAAPNQAELDLVYDTAFADIQPYLFKVNYSVTPTAVNPSMSTAVKKLLKDTLSFT